jgi:hypothetical protein
MDRQPRLRAHWEAIFHGRQRKIRTLIIGHEAVSAKIGCPRRRGSN